MNISPRDYTAWRVDPSRIPPDLIATAASPTMAFSDEALAQIERAVRKAAMAAMEQMAFRHAIVQACRAIQAKHPEIPKRVVFFLVGQVYSRDEAYVRDLYYQGQGPRMEKAV